MVRGSPGLILRREFVCAPDHPSAGRSAGAAPPLLRLGAGRHASRVRRTRRRSGEASGLGLREVERHHECDQGRPAELGELGDSLERFVRGPRDVDAERRVAVRADKEQELPRQLETLLSGDVADLNRGGGSALAVSMRICRSPALRSSSGASASSEGADVGDLVYGFKFDRLLVDSHGTQGPASVLLMLPGGDDQETDDPAHGLGLRDAVGLRECSQLVVYLRRMDTLTLRLRLMCSSASGPGFRGEFLTTLIASASLLSLHGLHRFRAHGGKDQRGRSQDPPLFLSGGEFPYGRDRSAHRRRLH